MSYEIEATNSGISGGPRFKFGSRALRKRIGRAFKKALPFVAAAGALAIPGVAPALAKAGAGLIRGAGRAVKGAVGNKVVRRKVAATMRAPGGQPLEEFVEQPAFSMAVPEFGPVAQEESLPPMETAPQEGPRMALEAMPMILVGVGALALFALASSRRR